MTIKVKIKTWDAMVKEFGFFAENTFYNHINCEGHFLPAMENMIPKDRIIEVNEYDLVNNKIEYLWYTTRPASNNEYGGIKPCRWHITEDMIEKIIK